MKRRLLLKAAVLPVAALAQFETVWGVPNQPSRPLARVRPGDPCWPSAASWHSLEQQVAGRLVKLSAPFVACVPTPTAASTPQACTESVAKISNSFAIRDEPSLTQASGWLDGWRSQPSAYAVVASSTTDVVAAVNFASTHRLRLVVKGGGHSYQGSSDAADSLLVWTRHMDDVTLHPAFVARGCAASIAPQPAVTIGAGALWIDAYHAVTTLGGRYVQGGGCTTVGVAGLVQGGGFSNFSKRYGTAAAGLLEAEVVSADGKVLIANACTNPDLFWALKGGGGGSFGIITRLTLRTRELPDQFGAVFFSVKASSDTAFRALIAETMAFYARALFNPHWGEQVSFKRDSVHFSLVFQDLSQQQASDLWAPFLAWLRARPEFTFDKPFQALALPARHVWDITFFKKNAPALMVADPRAGVPAHHALWKGDGEQAGQFIHGYQSTWMPATLLAADQQGALVDAVFDCTRFWSVGFHFNKGLAGAPAAEIAAARDTATNPAVLNAFALAIIAGAGSAQYPGMPSAAFDLAEARDHARSIDKAMATLKKVAPETSAYVSESDYFQSNWQTAFWGVNHVRLAQVKQKFDPNGLFFVRHGVGSEGWSDDGFVPLTPG